jgi:putative aldouronate transport system permease protein
MIIVITLMPFVFIVAQSFSDQKYIYQNDISFYPKGFNLTSYKTVIFEKYFVIGYMNTVIYTLTGTLLSLLLTTTLAYALSKKYLKGRTIFLSVALFTMFFQGGLIPSYIFVKTLGMKNTIWAVIVPGALSTYNMIVMKTFFEQLPAELEEAAMMDGASTYKILLSIILPLSKPILATMFLFYAVGAWNNWFGPFLYLENKDLHPVTLYLRNIIAGVQQTSASSGSDDTAAAQISATVKSTVIVLTSVPIILVYPFIQKHFIKGVMIGAIKG